jgi:hypothetical protein
MYVVVSETEYREAITREGETVEFRTIRSTKGKKYKVLWLNGLIVIPQQIAEDLGCDKFEELNPPIRP